MSPHPPYFQTVFRLAFCNLCLFLQVCSREWVSWQLHSTILHSHHCTVINWATLHCSNAIYYTAVLYYITLQYCTTLHCSTVLHCTAVLYYIALQYCTTLHCSTALHCTAALHYYTEMHWAVGTGLAAPLAPPLGFTFTPRCKVIEGWPPSLDKATPATSINNENAYYSFKLFVITCLGMQRHTWGTTAHVYSL